MDLELARLALRNTHKPHRLCKDVAGDLFEFISYPYIAYFGGDERLVIKARVPGDPTTIFTADALALDPEGKDCLCSEAGKDFYLTPIYYADRSLRLTQSPAYISGGER